MKSLIKLLCIATFGIGLYNASLQASTLHNYPLEGGRNFFITGDLLIWKSQHEGAEITVVADTSNTLFNRNRIFPHNQFTAGFRLGAGYVFPSHDEWDIYGYYTQFNNHNCRTISATAERTPLNLYTNDTASIVSLGRINTVNGYWDLHLKIADLELGKSFIIQDFLKLRPHFGLRGAQIKQKSIITNTGGSLSGSQSPDIITHKTNFGGIGLQCGINTQWDLFTRWCYLSDVTLYGDAAAALLIGTVKNSNVETMNSQPFLQAYSCPHLTQPIMDLALGLRWNRSFNNNCLGVLVQLGWEQHWFSKSWRVTRNNLITPGFDLFVYGITLSARLDF